MGEPSTNASPQAATVSRFAANSSLPRFFGRLTLLKQLARGGMGEVYLAAAGAIEGAERPCVVKVIRRDHANDPSFVARFLDEARVQAQLEHSGVARVLEAAIGEDGKPYVVVELVEGRSVAEARTRAAQLGVKIRWTDAAALGASVAEGLAYVHERHDARGRPLNIVHRDLSPQNIMVGFSGDTKLIDFGTARAENRRCHTVSGVVYAKPGYVAPEVANGISGGAPVDIYALGVIIWELCAGRRFLQGDANEHLAAVAADKRSLPPLAQLVGAPPELDALLAKMTAFDAATRLGSAREAHAELLRLVTSAPRDKARPGTPRDALAALLSELYPGEPSRSRSEFQRLVVIAQKMRAEVATPRPETLTVDGAHVDDTILPGTCYRLDRRIGEGAAGVVFDATHVELGRRSAVKVLGPEQAKSHDAAARFRREARAMSRLAHPNVVRLHDFGRATDGRLFLAMEYVEGQTLERRVEVEGEIPIDDALRVVARTARVLDDVHALGVVHRDVKPANLLMTHAGDVKLLDFGLAFTTGESEASGPHEAHGEAQAIAVYGTPEYVAPEQIEGNAVDGRADVYALGAVLYELLAGTRPFLGSAVAVLEAKRSEAAERPSKRAPARGISPEIDAIVMRALERSPEARFASAAEFALAIERSIAKARASWDGRRRRAAVVFTAAMGGALVLLATASRPWAPGVWRYVDGHAKMSAPAVMAQAAMPAVEPTPTLDAHVAVPEGPVVAPVDAPPANAPAANGPDVDASKPDTATPSTPAPLAPLPKPDDAHASTSPPMLPPPDATAAAATEHEATKPEAPRGSRQDLRAKARAAVAANHWDEARALAEQWAKVDSAPEPRIVLARALAFLGRRGEAKRVLLTVLDSDRSNDDARSLLRRLEDATPARHRSEKRAIRGKAASRLATTSRSASSGLRTGVE